MSSGHVVTSSYRPSTRAEYGGSRSWPLTTAPLLAYYEATPTPVHLVGGVGPVAEVQERIVRLLEG